MGRPEQAQAAAPAACGRDPAIGGQDHHDLGEVAARNAVRFGNLVHRGRVLASITGRAVHQHAQAVVGPLGESHRVIAL